MDYVDSHGPNMMENQESHDLMIHETLEKDVNKRTSWKKCKKVQTQREILKRNYV